MQRGVNPQADTGLWLASAVLICIKEVVSMPLVKCPMCGRMVEYEGNEFRPFCSERCKLLDFGAWADERYNLPAETTEMTEEDIDRIQQAMEKKPHNGH
jgi:uncharacterized protein